MGYNWAKEKMKKNILALALLLSLFSMACMTSNASNISVPSTLSFDVKSTIHVDVELRNDEYNQVLCLYSDGTCVIRRGNGRGSGTYDINRGSITIHWENGTKQQGNAIFDEGQLKSVRIEGVTYSRRLVKSRR